MNGFFVKRTDALVVKSLMDKDDTGFRKKDMSGKLIGQLTRWS